MVPTPSGAPVLNFTVPEPTGVVATLAPNRRRSRGIVSRILPALGVSGNVVVAVAIGVEPLAAIELAEAVATSDMPAAPTSSPAAGASWRRSSPATPT